MNRPAAAADSPAAVCRRLIRAARSAALATSLSRQKAPGEAARPGVSPDNKMTEAARPGVSPDNKMTEAARPGVSPDNKTTEAARPGVSPDNKTAEAARPGVSPSTDEKGRHGPKESWPYASLVTVACDTDASPVLLLSHLSDHTRNLGADGRASLLFEAASRRANPQTGPRVTVMGRIERTADERLARRFLARHPGAGRYAGFTDFGFHRMKVERAHYVGGFAKAVWIKGRELLSEAKAAAALAALEESVLEHMNGDHAEAIDLYANGLLGRRGTGWKMVGIDAEGADLRRGAHFARLEFENPVEDADSCRRALSDLARRARAAT